VRTRSRALGGLVALLALVASPACGDDAAPAPPEGSRAVTFPGPAGSRLSGRELGEGPVTLVLAHGATTDMTSWYAPMKAFADAGYRVLAFDSRGVGDSTGTASTDPAARIEDIDAALRSARRTGATRVVVMGSSLGAQAALLVAERPDAVDGVVGVSPATVPDGAASISVPAFFVASDGDAGPAGNARALARELDAGVEIVQGSIHGADLFADHPEATRAVVDFVTGAVPVR
jgi:pimeloyl-ACP methyl ester carboxylesterase